MARLPHGRRGAPGVQGAAIVGTAEWVAVGFDLGIVEVVPPRRRGQLVGHLGPDLLGATGTPTRPPLGLWRAPERPIGRRARSTSATSRGSATSTRTRCCFLRGMLRPPDRPNGCRRARRPGARLILANRDRVERTTTGDTRPGARPGSTADKGRPAAAAGPGSGRANSARPRPRNVSATGARAARRRTGQLDRSTSARKPVDALQQPATVRAHKRVWTGLGRGHR